MEQLHPQETQMASPRPPERPHPKPRRSEQLGNGEGGRAHWPLDLELHPDKEDKPVNVPNPDWDDEDEN
jgi:hypothetical protein